MFSKAKPKQGPSPSTPPTTKPSGVPSIVSPELTIKGNLASSGDIQVDGTVEGDVEAANLTIGENGAVHGKVSARIVRICGRVAGEVHGGEVMLAASAHVYGDIVHDSLAIEAGADIEGHCRRRDNAANGAGDAKQAAGRNRGKSSAAAVAGQTETQAPAKLANGSAEAAQGQPESKPAE
ncbi:bactofilin family protein [Ferruginivarius sediminum]|uniref:Polymer-forming cytoskeletal protein n=1 Tax=Ferruginivarius sediminum TaxID=2661937 RepID=A0A369TEF5_9PROT|nr:polymer-forming cytoskeletal protein [Ferruginivarius sediminum]RDD63731.1 polymer-forming cytoskeletal protein [Ferruginivarius sediminum]